jgi:hypothetical protein
MMNNLERFCCFAGVTLIGLSAMLLCSRDSLQRRQRSRTRRNHQPPVERLAENLKEAWAGHHTQA